MCENKIHVYALHCGTVRGGGGATFLMRKFNTRIIFTAKIFQSMVLQKYLEIIAVNICIFFVALKPEKLGRLRTKTLLEVQRNCLAEWQLFLLDDSIAMILGTTFKFLIATSDSPPQYEVLQEEFPCGVCVNWCKLWRLW